MDLNRKGTVVGLSGMNADGQALLADYDGKGKDKTLVADELIDRALDMGFLTAGGQVAFLIDAPEEEIFEAYGIELRTQVGKQLEGSVPFDIVIMEYEGRCRRRPRRLRAISEWRQRRQCLRPRGRLRRRHRRHLLRRLRQRRRLRLLHCLRRRRKCRPQHLRQRKHRPRPPLRQRQKRKPRPPFPQQRKRRLLLLCRIRRIRIMERMMSRITGMEIRITSRIGTRIRIMGTMTAKHFYKKFFHEPWF